MAEVEDEEVTSSGPVENLWSIAITSTDDSNVPQKSSNEILTELFGAFNAEPPKSPIVSEGNSETENKAKKHKKKHKKEKKHKKKSKTKRRLSGEQDNSSVGCSSESEDEHEKRKERKHKHKKRHRVKGSDMESGDEHKPKKRSRHSKSPLNDVKKDLIVEVKKEPTNDIINEPMIVIKKEPVDNVENDLPKASEENEKDDKPQANGSVEPDTSVVSSSTPVPSSSPPPLPVTRSAAADETAVFETVKSPDTVDEKTDKGKPVGGKIVIKNLKFSSVYEATVKEVEEQAKAKAEKYEEGELSDSSSQKTSDVSDDLCNGPSLGSEGGEAAEPSVKSDDRVKRSSRSRSKEKSSSHHKKSRHRSRSKEHESKSRDKDRHCRHKDKGRDKEKEKEKDKDKDRDKERNKEKDKDRHKDKDRSRDKERERDRDRDRERDKDKDKDKQRERDRDRKDKDNRDRRRERSRSRSHHGSRNRSSSRSRRHHSRDRRRSRSRSRDRKRTSGGDHIDKKKLLEIARKNAMNMLQAGILPAGIMGTAGAANQAAAATKPEKNAAKTVDELTEYCKELSKRENLGELSSLSGSDDSDSEKPFHHPFQVKDRPSFISMNIKNAVQLPLKTLQERTVEHSQLRIQFPVSSGQQHRKTESEWVPVTPQKKPEEKKSSSSSLKAIEAPKPAEPTPNRSHEVIDIGTMVSQRLAAMRKMHDSEQSRYSDHLHGWNNVLPGQYTGDTGLRLLTPQQLASGAQAWARKDQLQTATPVRSGMGMTLLQKMGWKPGEGLGKNKEGCQEPLQLEVKMDRKGLVAAEEVRARRPPPTVTQPAKAKANPVTLEGKHPVSLLTEYCSKRHFGAPHFELCMEAGPDHKKDFLFKVRVNGLEYTPSVSSPNKKQAKAEAASVCLKALGVLIS